MPARATSWKHPQHPLELFQPASARGRAKFYYRISLPGQPRAEGRLCDHFSYSDRHFKFLAADWDFEEIRDNIRRMNAPDGLIVEYAVRVLNSLKEKVGKGGTVNPIRVPSVAKAATKYVQHLKLEHAAGRITDEHLRKYRGFYARYVIPYPLFDRVEIADITEEMLRDWQRWRDTYWSTGPGKDIEQIRYTRDGKEIVRDVRPEDREPPTLSTKRKERSYLTGVFKFAADMKWLERRNVPKLDLSGMHSSPSTKRPAFTMDQWNRLAEFAEATWLNPPKLTGDNRRIRRLCWWFVVTLRAFGLRASEGYVLRFRNVIDTLDDKGEPTIFIHVPAVKSERHQRPVEPIFRFVEQARQILLKDLPALYEAEYGFKPDPDDPLWMHQDRQPIRNFYRSFESLLKEAGMEHDAELNPYSLGSLRHSAITDEIENTNLPVPIIADWAGTSIKMINDHYAQPLVTRARRRELEQRMRARSGG